MDDKKAKAVAIKRHRKFVAVCLAVIVVALSVSVFSIAKTIKILDEEAPSSSSSEQTESQEEKVKKIASVTVVNTGDVLIHNPVLYGAEKASGEYDFSSLFKPVSSYFKAADLSVINLEVTLGGTESGKYNGYPAFNTPDTVIDALKDAGINMLLTANNHCYDTGLFGLKRTVKVLKEKNIEYIGTREEDTEPTYIIKNVNGIKLGMACYTYSSITDTGRVAINGATLKPEAEPLVNTFSYNKLEEFYSTVQQTLSEMKDKGADCTVFYIHWGDEYRLKPNENQKSMAQRLCNLGVDVIVGGHPHVVEPIELLRSEGGDHTTVCLYSMGNAVSNQRREEMTGLSNQGHTEDGVLFYYTFDKYSDGTTVLASVDIIPTWVQKTGSRYSAQYSVYALENAQDGIEKLSLGSDLDSAKKSYERTKEIIAKGLTECQQALGCKVRFDEIQ